MDEKDPYAYDKVYFARAPKQGSWLRRVRAEPAEYATTSDFSHATPFDSKAEAIEAWGELRAALVKKGGQAPAWVKDGQKDPAVFCGVSPEAPPARLRLFLAMSQGRFVGEEGAGISRRWVMAPDIEGATVFTSQSAAMSGLASALPARGDVTGSILPLECAALPPMGYRDLPADPLAGAMSARSARFDLEASTPGAEAPTPDRRARPRGL